MLEPVDKSKDTHWLSGNDLFLIPHMDMMRELRQVRKSPFANDSLARKYPRSLSSCSFKKIDPIAQLAFGKTPRKLGGGHRQDGEASGRWDKVDSNLAKRAAWFGSRAMIALNWS